MRHRRFQKRPVRRSLMRDAPGIVLGVAAVVAAGVYSLSDFSSVAAVAKGCAIKGNISINSREKIFHVPGQYYYDATIIRPEYGERWFCTEAEARAAGWRKAGV